jgi:uncharacterized protein
MEFVADIVAFCRAGFGGALQSSASLPLSLFLAGLAGSVVHCIGMCGPFVLGQVMGNVMGDAQAIGGGYGEWRRLAGAALIPYHLGRFTSYTAIGAVAGGATALFTASPAFAWLAAGLLVLAAGLMLAQAFGMAIGTDSSLAGPLGRLAAPLARTRSAPGRYALGVVLGFLPCGLLYGAIAAAGGTASASEGALAMAAFAAGTMPALVAVGWGGAIMRRRLKDVARWVGTPLLLANAALLVALASQRL